jgi:hypothetical protein
MVDLSRFARRAAAVLALAYIGVASAQTAAERDIAERLTRPDSRRSAVQQVAAAQGRWLPVLLSWARNPPDSIQKAGAHSMHEFQIGLADVFGEIRAKEAIPFLIEHISIERVGLASLWSKTPEVIDERLAAAAALIRIGPEAARAITDAFWTTGMPGRDHFAAIYVVSRIDGAESRKFLDDLIVHLDFERLLAQRGRARER